LYCHSSLSGSNILLEGVVSRVSIIAPNDFLGTWSLLGSGLTVGKGGTRNVNHEKQPNGRPAEMYISRRPSWLYAVCLTGMFFKAF